MKAVQEIAGPALVLSDAKLDILNAKTTHGLLRGSQRFDVLAVIDRKFAGQDAGEVMDGKKRDIPIFAKVGEAIASLDQKPVYCVIGVATSGGYLPPSLKKDIQEAIQAGLSIVNGLHYFLNDDPILAPLAQEYSVDLYDIRKPRPRAELQFWTGEILHLKIPRIAVLGMDCAVGKRTTAKFLTDLCEEKGLRAEMIFTGQTGWMQGYRYGLFFDAMVNDFIGGEIEKAILDCARETQAEVIFIEGQSALRNPSGPCGSEFILSGGAKGVILQHVPGRKYYEDTKVAIPPVESEIQLIEHYGAKVLALTLNEGEMEAEELRKYQEDLRSRLSIPAIRPLNEGFYSLVQRTDRRNA
ncbi:MAG: DUF1611 domain-containing protein [Bacteroidota bacterium]